jgi:hypothetical protein
VTRATPSTAAPDAQPEQSAAAPTLNAQAAVLQRGGRRMRMRSEGELPDSGPYPSPIPPYALGSHASRLVKLVREGREDVKPTAEEFIRPVTRIDATWAYYGSHLGRRNLKGRDHVHFRPLAKLSGTIEHAQSSDRCRPSAAFGRRSREGLERPH